MIVYRSLRLLLVLTAAACLISPASAGVRRHDVPLLDYLDLGDQFPSVGYVLAMQDADLTGFASGVLIAPHWVLTAAHVIDKPTDNRFRFGVRTTPNSEPTWVWEYEATNWIVHPDWVGESMGGLFKGSDIGLLHFDENIAALEGAGFPPPPIPHITSIEPAKRYTGSDELGKLGTSVGFGLIGTGDTEDDPLTPGVVENRFFAFLQRWAGQNVIDILLGDATGVPGDSTDILVSDFDNPIAFPPTNDNSDNSWGSALPRDLEYLVFSGDSGGGLFVEDANGDPLLAGIHSFSWPLLDGVFDSDYGDASGHTRVSAFNDWINSTIPEPSSMIVWSLIVGLSFAGRWWQRKGA